MQLLHLWSVTTYFFKQRVISRKIGELITESDLKSYDMRIVFDFTNNIFQIYLVYENFF